MVIIIFIIFILTIILLSAIVSSSEAALLTVSIAKIKETQSKTKNKKTKKTTQNLLEIKENLQRYLSTIVILNNIINIIGSMYVGILATDIFGKIYLGLISAILTFLIIIFAEIIPKLYGEKYSLEISLLIANILKKITFLFSPLIKFIEFITIKLVKENPNNGVSEEEIKELAVLSREEGNISKKESERITNLFKLDDISVYDIMVPKNKTTVLDYNTNFDEVINIINETGFTRIPIEKEGEIIGLINVKDIFRYYNKKDKFMIAKILRPIIYAPEGMNLNALEEKFKKERYHLAIVINEHGDFIGIVTFEDLIEEVFGEIEDEFDKIKKPLIKKLNEHQFIIDPSINLEDLENKLHIKLKEINQEYTTLNGYLIDKFGNLPKVNQKIKTKKYTIRILRVNKKRILEIEIFLKY